jgi:hypothetical protein
MRQIEFNLQELRSLPAKCMFGFPFALRSFYALYVSGVDVSECYLLEITERFLINLVLGIRTKIVRDYLT